jgi:putative phosphoesterase
MTVHRRVAALYDVHGNRPALDAVLADVARAGVDAIVFGGDLAAGPLPVPTLARVRAIASPVVRFVRGNGDREVLAPREGDEPPAVMSRFVAERLGPDERALIEGFEAAVVLEIAGLGTVRFVHATPRDDTEILTALTPPARWRPMFAGVTEDVVVCGHTHRQADRRLGDVRVVNAGSVGMPYEGVAGARWALLGPEVELRRTEVDVGAMAAAIRASGYPLAEDMLAESFTRPVDPDEVERFFEPAE